MNKLFKGHIRELPIELINPPATRILIVRGMSDFFTCLYRLLLNTLLLRRSEQKNLLERNGILERFYKACGVGTGRTGVQERF